MGSLYEPLALHPDNSLLEIFLRVTPSLQHVMDMSLVCKRFHILAQSPQLWSLLYDSTPGFEIEPSIRQRLMYATDAPAGTWEGDQWHSGSSQVHTESIHYPTLYRSRLALDRMIRTSNHPSPPQRWVSKQHTDTVYCVDLSSPWLVTGSRDTSVRFWRIDNLNPDDPQMTCAKTLVHAHGGSVLGLRFELDEDGRGGILLTGSSDTTACLWRVNIGDTVKVVKIATFRGHTAGVLDVSLGKTRVATW